MNTLYSIRLLLALLVLASLSFSLPGCGTSPPPRVYTLNSTSVPVRTGTPGDTKSPSIVGIGPVDIPDYLDRSQIVVRTSKNQLTISEFDLWGGSLKEDVGRVLLENVGAFLAPSGVLALPWRSYVPCALRVPVTILRLDAVKGENVSLRARWTLVGKETNRLTGLRESVLTVPVRGAETSDAVAAMSEALEALSKDIAASIKDALARK